MTNSSACTAARQRYRRARRVAVGLALVATPLAIAPGAAALTDPIDVLFGAGSPVAHYSGHSTAVTTKAAVERRVTGLRWVKR